MIRFLFSSLGIVDLVPGTLILLYECNRNPSDKTVVIHVGRNVPTLRIVPGLPTLPVTSAPIKRVETITLLTLENKNPVTLYTRQVNVNADPYDDNRHRFKNFQSFSFGTNTICNPFFFRLSIKQCTATIVNHTATHTELFRLFSILSTMPNATTDNRGDDVV